MNKLDLASLVRGLVTSDHLGVQDLLEWTAKVHGAKFCISRGENFDKDLYKVGPPS